MMNDTTKIALAQISAYKGDVDANIKKHLQMIEVASEQKSDFIIFPELSLTGYEPALARELAFDPADRRLEPLQEAARKHRIVIIAGAPIRCMDNLYLGAFVLFPNGTCTAYTKRFLHPGEEQYFVPYGWNPLLIHKGDVISLAICADILNPLHAKTAHENNSTVYLASACITPDGYPGDTAALKNYAREHRMTAMMVNYCGAIGGYETAGGSTVIDVNGDAIAALDPDKEGILIAHRKDNDKWSCYSA